uniref:Uncharacterized protein n=1 Tax=Cucumis melo TaxID=3656 RepID=A0A9I9ELY3_CUCME
ADDQCTGGSKSIRATYCTKKEFSAGFAPSRLSSKLEKRVDFSSNAIVLGPIGVLQLRIQAYGVRNHKLGSRFLFELCVSFFSFPPICFKYTKDNPIGFPWNNLDRIINRSKEEKALLIELHPVIFSRCSRSIPSTDCSFIQRACHWISSKVTLIEFDKIKTMNPVPLWRILLDAQMPANFFLAFPISHGRNILSFSIWYNF